MEFSNRESWNRADGESHAFFFSMITTAVTNKGMGLQVCLTVQSKVNESTYKNLNVSVNHIAQHCKQYQKERGAILFPSWMT